MKKNIKKRSGNVLYHYAAEEVVNGASPGLSGDCSCLWGDCSGLEGNCSDISGDCSGLRGNCTGLWGDLDDCEIGYVWLDNARTKLAC